MLIIPLLNLVSAGIPEELFKRYLLGIILEGRYFSAHGLSQKTSLKITELYGLLKQQIKWDKILYAFARSLLNNNDWYLMLDATPLEQHHAKNRITKHGLVSIEGKKNIPHNQMLSLVLTNGRVQLVLDYRIWVSPKVARQKDYKKQTTLALELLKHCLLRQLHVSSIVFDSFFSSKEIITWLNQNGFLWTTRLKGNRIVYILGKAYRLDELLTREGDIQLAELKGIMSTVKITRIHYQDEVVYAATNNVEAPQQKIVKVYRLRWKIEEFHREAKQNLGLNYLWMRNFQALKKSSRLCLPCLQHSV